MKGCKCARCEKVREKNREQGRSYREKNREKLREKSREQSRRYSEKIRELRNARADALIANSPELQELQQILKGETP